jgi:hypothetical protein
MNDEMAPGTEIMLFGHAWTVGAHMLTGDERYYALTDSRGMVALMPAEVVEVGHKPAARHAPTAPQLPHKRTPAPRTAG